jgi:hypothetical protein
MNILLFSMPDSFEHMPAFAIASPMVPSPHSLATWTSTTASRSPT